MRGRAHAAAAVPTRRRPGGGIVVLNPRQGERDERVEVPFDARMRHEQLHAVAQRVMRRREREQRLDDATTRVVELFDATERYEQVPIERRDVPQLVAWMRRMRLVRAEALTVLVQSNVRDDALKMEENRLLHEQRH